ncbi:hypothetical protein M422DRAFT_27192 [Sphaerobolus stellatus SS14]|nr:hypothetical protein M422DRAFT_27192 [Sphaerobolus stellatus SS14]
MNETVLSQAPLFNLSFINGYFEDDISPYFPADSFCVPFAEDNSTGSSYDVCPVTGQMINFLNLTAEKAFAKYFVAYCALGAPQDDGCPYGWCPNSDIASPLVRIATYVITSFVTIVVYYEPEAVAESFFSQLLTMYSFLITSFISISKSELTRIHAVMATGLVGSPLSIYLFIYAIRSIWGGGDRMHIVLGKGRILVRGLVLAAAGIWIALIIYILVPNTEHFAQRSCEKTYSSLVFRGFWFLPLVIIRLLLTDPDSDAKAAGGFILFLFLLPVVVTVLAWIFAIVRRHKEIWPVGQPYRPRIYTVWSTVVTHYPAIRFMSVVLLPTGYWITIIEFGAIVSNDEQFQTTFGQVLACFAAVPPIIQAVKMLPRLWAWFRRVTACCCCCRSRISRSSRARLSKMGDELADLNNKPLPVSPNEDQNQYYIEPFEIERGEMEQGLYDAYESKRVQEAASATTLRGDSYTYTSLRKDTVL